MNHSVKSSKVVLSSDEEVEEIELLSGETAGASGDMPLAKEEDFSGITFSIRSTGEAAVGWLTTTVDEDELDDNSHSQLSNAESKVGKSNPARLTVLHWSSLAVDNGSLASSCLHCAYADKIMPFAAPLVSKGASE